MRMTKAVAILASAVALSACGPDESRGSLSTDPAEIGIAASQHGSIARPVKGSCTVTSTEFVSFNPPILRQVGFATCQLSQLGLTSVRNEQTINVATGGQTGSATWTAPNGDLVFLTSEGTSEPAVPGQLSFSGTATITGGTGRFEGAAGELDVVGIASTSDGSGSFSYRGSIVY